ncbi:MAG: VWA domain-containing protein [Acidobacteriota bacterium]
MLLVAQVPAAAQQRFRATVSRVRVDVIVTDDDGNFVVDLGINDFRLFEDGRPEQVLNVQLVDLAAGRVVDLPRGPEEEAPVSFPTAPAASDSAPDTSIEDRSAAATSDLGAIVFFVDATALGQRTKVRFVDALDRAIGRGGELAVPQAIYLVDQLGHLKELAPLMLDVDRLHRVIRVLRDTPLVRQPLRDQLITALVDTDSLAAAPTSGLSAGQSVGCGALRAWVNEKEANERARSLYSYKLLTQFSNSLSARSGRTALVWVSSGVKLMQGGPFAGLLAARCGGDTGLYSPDQEILRRQEELHRAANSANVSIYSLDPSLLADLHLDMANAQIGPLPPGVYGGRGSPRAVLRRVNPSLQAERDSLRHAAKETGGKAFIAWTDLGKALEAMEADTSRYYLLSYMPPAPEGDGEYHQIRVEVARKEVSVRARQGYTDYAAEERRSRRIEAALSLPGTVADLPVRAEAFRSWSASGEVTILLAATVEAAEVGLQAGGDGALFASLDLHVAAFDDDGEVVDRLHDQFGARASAATAAGAPRHGFLVYRREWKLEPGDYDLRVAVMDEATGRMGATKLELQIPERMEEGWGTSDVLLIGTGDSNGTEPIVGGQVEFGKRITAYLEVYGGKSPMISGRLARSEVASESTPKTDPLQGAAAPATVELEALPLQREADGIHRGTLALPIQLQPGDYTLQIELKDQPANATRAFTIPLHVLPPPEETARPAP